jgi:SPP1 family predicted phage head-tail adaptor
MSRDPGQMNRRVTVRTAGTPVPDGGGGWTPGSPAEVDTDMHIEPLQGDELIQAMQTGMRRPHKFTGRYRADITGATTLVYQTRTFDVQSIVDPDMKHERLVILADETKADGVVN